MSVILFKSSFVSFSPEHVGMELWKGKGRYGRN